MLCSEMPRFDGMNGASPPSSSSSSRGTWQTTTSSLAAFGVACLSSGISSSRHIRLCEKLRRRDSRSAKDFASVDASMESALAWSAPDSAILRKVFSLSCLVCSGLAAGGGATWLTNAVMVFFSLLPHTDLEVTAVHTISSGDVPVLGWGTSPVLRLRFSGNGSQTTGPLASSCCTRNLYSRSTPGGMVSGCEDHSGKASPVV
mmetsp:Transcript_48320/g.136568  ORF Transcript_48320/g.136568 Transcript_48320/m.136568 type:complete len:203 (+) Transcript_48320:909-1517(+)